MDVGKKRLILPATLCALFTCAILTGLAGQPAPAARIVSLVPSVTEMLFAMGAGPDVVAVSSYDNFPPAVQTLPRVGALLDPDVERILALRPTLVVTYGSQTDLERQLGRAGIRMFSYRHAGVAGVMKSLRDLGVTTGHQAQADTVARDLQKQLDGVAARVRGRPRPRTLFVFGREPGSLQQIYASGGTGFLDDILAIAGGMNVLADVTRESVQPSREALLRLSPDVILEVRAAAIPVASLPRERAAWAPLASVPAVRSNRIHFLFGEYLVTPGPRLGIATEAIARVLHPEAFQ